jgi:predicted metal-dependent hydrolase
VAISDRAKHLRITVRGDRAVRLTIPRGVSLKKARQFLDSKIPWIRKHLRRFERLGDNCEPAPLPPINRTKARAFLIARLEAMAELHDFKFTKVSIRNQKTKWGSCSARNNISLNMNLVRLPAELTDYVLLHELVHTRIKNHSSRFWAELDVCVGGGARALSKMLKGYGLPM